MLLGLHGVAMKHRRAYITLSPATSFRAHLREMTYNFGDSILFRHPVKKSAERSIDFFFNCQMMMMLILVCGFFFSEVTYNLVLTCAVESLRDRFIRRGHDLSHLNIDEVPLLPASPPPLPTCF